MPAHQLAPFRVLQHNAPKCRLLLARAHRHGNAAFVANQHGFGRHIIFGRYVHAAEQPRRRFRHRTAEQLFRRVVLDDAAVLQNRHPVGRQCGFGRVVRDQQRRNPVLAHQFAHQSLQLPAQSCVQAGKRLVQQQHFRRTHQGARQGYALLFAARQSINPPVGRVLQAHLRQKSFGFFLGNALALAAHPQPERHVLPHVQMRQQGKILKHHCHFAFLRRQRIQQRAAQHDFAAVGRQQPSHHVQQRGFTAARCAQNRRQAACLHAQINAVRHYFVRKPLVQPPNLQHFAAPIAENAHYIAD